MIIEKYQKLISKDIETIINHIFDNYTVTEKNTSIEVEKNTIISHFLSKKEPIIKRCCGINQNGSQCSRNTLENKMYCKIHILKYDTSLFSMKQTPQKLEQIELQKNEFVDYEKCEKPDVSQLKKIFIDDSFYYVDEKYMYDYITKEKIGFIDNGEYILSNDPFILQ